MSAGWVCTLLIAALVVTALLVARAWSGDKPCTAGASSISGDRPAVATYYPKGCKP